MSAMSEERALREQMYDAASNGDVEELRRLIEAKAVVNAANAYVSVYLTCSGIRDHVCAGIYCFDAGLSLWT
jgi:hypothetical protein